MIRYFLYTFSLLTMLMSIRLEAACNQLDCCETTPSLYMGAFGGANFFQISKKTPLKNRSETGYTGAIALGVQYFDKLRTEGEISYRWNDMKHMKFFGNNLNIKGHTTSLSLMVNQYYDMSFGVYVRPYIGIGMGYTDLKVRAHHRVYKHESYKSSAEGFCCQAIGGLDIPVTAYTHLALEYRYFKGRENVREQNLGLAIRHYF